MTTASAQGALTPRPRTREEILERVGTDRAKIYAMVRTTLDDLEAVAPWEGLYYPPTESAEFLGMETALVGMIEDIPQRVASLIRSLRGSSPDAELGDVIDNLEFYFQGIQVSVASELAKLKDKLEGYCAEGAEPLSAEDRTYTCEISADLKGKYTSSIMGAAASLIAEGYWSGIEIEAILFPEKAEEFDRNEKLVETLSEVTESIGTFLDQVPLAELLASWGEQRRVDQYALAPLYSLLGDLGKLMQVSSRRALYSGDYHQIRMREGLLSTRINRLTTLHNTTWGTGVEGARIEGDTIYPIMIRTATELAAVLDTDILKKVVGASGVKDLLLTVTLEKEDLAAGRGGDERQMARRQRMPAQLRTLVPLLYDEDLKTFLELLLGSVLKRASLAVQRDSPEPVLEAAGSGVSGEELLPSFDLSDMTLPELSPSAVSPPDGMPPAPAVPTREPGPEDLVSMELPPLEFAPMDLDPPELTDPAVMEDETLLSVRARPSAPAAVLPPALEELLEVLQPLLSRNSSQRKSFELVRRLLKQQRTIPAGLLHSMRPYLFEVMNQVSPKLRDDPRLSDLQASYGHELMTQCQVLWDQHLAPDALGVDLPQSMERLLDLLNRLAIAARSSIERLSEKQDSSAGFEPPSW